MPNDNHRLYEFTQVLGHALKLIKTANEIPEFVLSKARDINAEQTLKLLEDFDNAPPIDGEAQISVERILKDIASRGPDSKVSNDLDFEVKKDLYDYIEKVQNALKQVQSPHYKLMLDRYIAANALAHKVQDLLAGLLNAEQELDKEKAELEEQS